MISNINRMLPKPFERSLKRFLSTNLDEAEDQRFQLFEPKRQVLKSPFASHRFVKKRFGQREKGFGHQSANKRKLLLFIFIFYFFLLYPRLLPSEEIQIITDRQYYPKALSLIQNAKKTINLIMFEAAYYKKYPNTPSNELIRELILTRKRGVKVEVLLEIMNKKKDRATQRNYQTGEILSKGGVEVFYDSKDKTTHAKVLIVDGESILMGSTNWTYHALAKNHEVNLLIKSPNLAKNLIAYFNNIKLENK